MIDKHAPDVKSALFSFGMAKLFVIEVRARSRAARRGGPARDFLEPHAEPNIILPLLLGRWARC